MIQCNNNALIKFLESQKLKPQMQKDTDQIFVVYKIKDQDYPLFFRIYEGNDLLQLLTFFPLQVPKNRFDAMARVLHLLNKELDIPGFGMDETVGLVFHRIMIPVFDNKIDTHLLETYLSAVPKICEQFFPAIGGTAQSNLSFEEILQKSTS